MQMNFESRSNARLNKERLEWLISTSDVESFLQEQINKICATVKKQGGEDMKISIRVVSSPEYGRDFLPFIVGIQGPIEDKQSEYNNIPDSLKPNKEDNSVRLKKIFYQLFANFTFTNEQRKAFNQREIQRQLKLYPKNMEELRRFIKPQRVVDGDMSIVTFFLDPIKVFHYMLEDPRKREAFDIQIVEWTKLNDDCKYEYSIQKAKMKRRKGPNRKEALKKLVNQFD